MVKSPFRGLRRASSGSSNSLNVASYPYPRTHTTLVVPGSVVLQRDRPSLDSPTSPSGTATPRPFHRPPLNRAIPPIPESRSNESIISQASQLHRHSISDSSVGCSSREQAQGVPTTLASAVSVIDNSVVIENKMAQNLGAKHATNYSSQGGLTQSQSTTRMAPPTPVTIAQPTTSFIARSTSITVKSSKPTSLAKSMSVESKPSFEQNAQLHNSISTPIISKKVTAVIVTSKTASSPIDPPASSAYSGAPPKSTRVVAKKKQTRLCQQEPPKSPLLSMAHNVRSRLNKLGNRLGRGSSRSPIRSSYSMVSMRRDKSDLNQEQSVNERLAKSSSMNCPNRPDFIPPPPPTSSPPADDELEPEDVKIVSPVYVSNVQSNIPRRLPTTTLIQSPIGGRYYRRLDVEDLPSEEGPIPAIDSTEVIKTPDENVPPAILLRKEDELQELPLPNAPQVTFKELPKTEYNSNSLPRKTKATAHVIVRQPSEPAYQTHKRSKSKDSFMMPKKKEKPEKGAESVKTTRSLKITYRGDDFTPVMKRANHKKSNSVEISKLIHSSDPKPSTSRIQPSATAGRIDEMKLHKRSFIPKSTIRWGHSKGRKAPLAQWESSRVKDSPATELAPSSFGSKLKSPSKVRRIAFWKFRTKSEEAASEAEKDTDTGEHGQTVLSEHGKTVSSEYGQTVASQHAQTGASVKSNHGRHASDVGQAPKTPKVARIYTTVRKSSTEPEAVCTLEKTSEAQALPWAASLEPEEEDRRKPIETETVRTVTTARIITRQINSDEDENGNVTGGQERDRSRLALSELLASPLTVRRPQEKQFRRALQAKQKSGLIDDEIDDQPMLISTELSLIDEHSEGTPLSQSAFPEWPKDQNRNVTTTIISSEPIMTLEKDRDGNFVQAITRSEQSPPMRSDLTAQYKPPNTTELHHKDHDHAAIEKVIEGLSQQLTKIREYAIEDEDEMQKLRTENNSLKEELEIKDRVINLLMNKLNVPAEHLVSRS
ncbi:unnamed protein product [Bursaphelenchus okinawaensis]|uniref:Uncharacterized protein n=1 Tax=Bursaphelenchus okinawaensis TaxID=465554 RepID=A0A811KV86_9BILA|nr:unnamed protein product [Bursaphelenchus okinawaensis]CAG9113869.1 unnamed protein product [Bursaphelenchus okinawaensis]